MNALPLKLLEQIHQVTQELPTPILESLIQVLMIDTNDSERISVKNRLLHLLPKANWRQVLSNLIDVWQTEANMLDSKAIASALAMAAHSKTRYHQELSVELVWTGPNPESLPLRRTDQTLLQLIRTTQHDLLIISFAIYNIPAIVQTLLSAINRGVRIRIIAETPEASDGKISFNMLSTFGAEILQRSQVFIWPKGKRPVDDLGRHGSLHTKCAIGDHQHLFISSANLTEYAMTLNMEMGVLVHNRNLANQVTHHVDCLISQNYLVPLDL